MVEFDRLEELLRSRTIETLEAEHENNNEKKEKASVSALEDRIGSSKVHESLSVPAGGLTIKKQIPMDEMASPAELAKAYVGSRPSKASSSVGSFRNQVFQEDANFPSLPSMSKRLDLSIAPRSVIRFSGIPEHSEHGYQTARTPGRSAIYRMSRSPYFKVGEFSRDGCSYPSSSQWTPSATKSGGRQVLKRRSSALDSDSGSFGPIHRIRQKSNLMLPSKEPHLSLFGNFLSSPSTPPFKDVCKGSMSVQKPLLVDERKYGSTDSQAMENEISSATKLAPKSSETAQKLFQQLDKLFPSPKEKPSELKTISRDESPSKLTFDMLHGRALKSMEDINSSKILKMQGSGKLDTSHTTSASYLPNIGNSHPLKLDMVKEKGHSKSVGFLVKSASESNGVSNAPIPSKDAKPGVRSENIAVTTVSSVALIVPKKPAFQMSAPEDSLELDDDDYNTRDLSGPLTTAKDDADAKISKRINVISETVILENPPITSFQSMPVSSSISFRKADKKAPIQSVVTEKANGFAFPVASDPCTLFEPPLTPTMATPLPDRPDGPKEQATSPVFNFGSKDAISSTFSSTTLTVNDTADIKVGEGLGSEPTLCTSSATTLAEGSTLDKRETEEAGYICKPFGNRESSGISTLSMPALFAFGTSATSSLSNGSPHSSLPIFPVPDTTALTLSEGPVSSISINSTVTTSVSSEAATFSTVPTFQFGSGISTAAPVTVSQPLDKSNIAILEANSVEVSPFNISSSTAQGTSAVFPSIVSSSASEVATSVTIFSSGGSSPALSTSIMSSGMSSSSSTPLFSSTAGSNSSVALSSAFPSTGSSVFGFGASTQSTGSSSSFANSSSQNSTSTMFCVTGGSTSSGSLFANNSSQNSTATIFGVTGGSIFGTQSTQPESGTSQITQSSTSQFGSFSSSPSFGLGNSSSGGLGISSFAPATSDAKPFTSSSAFSFSSGVASSCANSNSSFAPAATISLFGSSSQVSTSSIFASSSNTSQSMGFSFGSSESGSSSSPFTSGSSSGSVFSFTSNGTTASSTPSSQSPVFGTPNPSIGFDSSSPGNNQMNEDRMTDDTNQAGTLLVPTCGQPANPSPVPTFVFGSPSDHPSAISAFQFGNHQNPSLPQNPSPFQSAGNVEFTPRGSFSLDSEGGDKTGRKFVRVKRDKVRRK